MKGAPAQPTGQALTPFAPAMLASMASAQQARPALTSYAMLMWAALRALVGAQAAATALCLAAQVATSRARLAAKRALA